MFKYGQGIFSSIRKGISMKSRLASTDGLEDVQSKDSKISFSRKSLGLVRKRRREGGNMTPKLVQPYPNEECDGDYKQTKRQRYSESNRTEQAQSLLFLQIPEDVIHHILSFLIDSKDRYSLQLSCRKFRKMSNNTDMMRVLDLGGDPETGCRSILNIMETPEQAIEGLFEFARAGNIRALYMTGMIVTYCYGDKIGVSLLRHTASLGCLRSAYALGLILRDSSKSDSDAYLNSAIDSGFLPACQELFTSQQVKDRFGDLDALTLKRYFDPVGLNRLLGRCYLQCRGVRRVQSSHCWNPLCGRWAFKATPSFPHSHVHQLGNKSLPPLAPHLDASLSSLLPQSQRTCQHFVPAELTDSVGIVCSDKKLKLSHPFRVSRMKMCSSCRRAKYCSKLCQVYDWRSGRHKMECQYL